MDRNAVLVINNILNLYNQDYEFPETKLPVENLALNDTGVALEETLRLSKIMPQLKELHLCGNSEFV